VQAQAVYDTAERHLSSVQEVSREDALKAASGTLESVQGKYQAAQAALSYSEIRSPISGVVTERPLFDGETAAAGAPVVTVMDTTVLLAKVHLPQAQAQLLSNGGPADILIPSVEEPIQGKITLISPALDPGSTTVEVWIRVENSQGKLRPGMAVEVSLAGRSSSKALVVPSEAIVTTSAGKDTVMVIDSKGIAHQTTVKTGIVDDGKTQILSGLASGARVVTAGAFALDDGTPVKVVSSLDSEGDSDKPGSAGEGK